MISKNSITAMARQQQTSNMQSYMKGYASDDSFQDYKQIEEDLIKEKLKKSFSDFLGAFARITYRKVSLIKEKNQNFTEFMNAQYVHLNEIAEYLIMANEELLNDPDFGTKPSIKKLGEEGIVINSIHSLVKISMFYIAGTTNEEPNIIRIGIAKGNTSKNVFINGNIDICSDGEIIIQDFAKTICRTRWAEGKKYVPATDENGKIIYDIETSPADIRDSEIDLEQIDEIKDFFMQIFELADLKTKRPNTY